MIDMIELNRHNLSLAYSSYHPTDDQTYPLRFAFCNQALEAATGERQRGDDSWKSKVGGGA
jgi:hypothetical protein